MTTRSSGTDGEGSGLADGAFWSASEVDISVFFLDQETFLGSKRYVVRNGITRGSQSFISYPQLLVPFSIHNSYRQPLAFTTVMS